MSNLNINFPISTKFTDGSRVNVFETTELFVMENPELMAKLNRRVVIDPSDIDYAMAAAFNYLYSYKGGFRCFKAAFYRELATYGYVKRDYGLVVAAR